MDKKVMIKISAFLLIVWIGLGNAQIRTTNPDSALENILSRLEGTHLGLQAALQYALKNATSVHTAEAAYSAARGAVRREAGTFDPELFFRFEYLDQEQPTASFFAGAPVLLTTDASSNAGLRWRFPTGTNVEASMGALRLNTNSAFAFLNPQFTTFGSVTLRQSLLGGSYFSARKQLTKAERDREAAKARYDQAVLTTRTQVETGYWDLYAAERDYAVQKLTRDQAEAFLRETETRAKAGLIGPNQVANARTFLAEQEILLLDREEQLDRTSDQFASLIGVRPDGSMRRFSTVDKPPTDFPLEDVEGLVQQAIQSNLDLQASRADIDSWRTLSKAAGWEALPRIDLVGSLGGSGLSGTARDVVFGGDSLRINVSGGLEDALNQSFKRDFPSWSVGVEVSVPIGFRSGLGERQRLEADMQIAEQRYIEQKRALEEQVRASYRELFHGAQRLKAAKEGVDAAQEQVRIGLIEFQNGRSTAFELVRLGADFALAQQRYSQALVRSTKAAATLKRLTSGAYHFSASQ